MYSGGWLSVINPNPCSETYRHALLQLDLKAALDSLDQTAVNTALFGVEMHLFTREQLVEMLFSANFQLVADYGIRCVTDYIQNNEIKAQAEFYEQLVTLERALGERLPYKYLARFFHVLAQKETIE
jgi:S-adenosylmethionine-dependent methyltransferase